MSECRRRFRLDVCGADLTRRQVHSSIDEYRQLNPSEPLGKFGHKLLAAHHLNSGGRGKRLCHYLANGVVAAQRIAVTDDQSLPRQGYSYSAAALSPPPAASSACDRSPIMSSMCSIPTDRRIYPGVTPVASCSSTDS
jgi:hypothetical protein